MKTVKHFEKGLTYVASGVFNAVKAVNQYKPNPSFTPKWSDKPLLKSWQKTKPTLGFPRTTDSLCPNCVIEAREDILGGKRDVSTLVNEKVGEIKAQIIERDGEIWMIKDCPDHGHFEDLMAIDSKFLQHIEANFPGRDIQSHNDEKLHNHGSSTIKYGRGAVLTVDLTNRCNMMCDPCFMDANQVGFVHELSMEDVKEILDNAISIKPRRQMSVQFSGGEPTLSPYFLEAVRYSRKVGYNSVQAATNGIEFAKSKEFCREAAEAGLRFVYLQFDGVGNDANSHQSSRQSYLMLNLSAINNLHEAGVDIVLVTTLVNGVNNDQVGSIVRFALDNPKKVSFVSFQPVSFTGRDEHITEQRRLQQRYTLSHLAQDVQKQVGITEPTRDWFPLSLMGAFADFADLVHGPEADWGQVSCGCHPNCGVGTAVMINKETKEMAPVPEFLNIPELGRRYETYHRHGSRKMVFELDDGIGTFEKLQSLRRTEKFDSWRNLRKNSINHSVCAEKITEKLTERARLKTSKNVVKTLGTSCLLRECGFRICSITISAARKCALFLTEHRKAKFRSVLIIRESAGETLSNICTKMRRSHNGIKIMVATKFLHAARKSNSITPITV